MNKYYILQEYGEPILIHCKSNEDYSKIYHDLNNEGMEWKQRLGLPFNPLEVVVTGPRMIKLKAKGVTGFLKIGNIHLEITPKFLDSSSEDHGWRLALIQIMMITDQGHLFHKVYTTAKESTNHLSDLIARSFYYSLKEGINQGLPRTYLEESGSLKYFKGRLDIRRISEIFIKPDMIPCIYEEYTEDSVINRLLKWATLELAHKVYSPRLSHDLSEIAAGMSQVSNIRPNIKDVDNLELLPEYSYLSEAFNIAKLLLNQISVEHGLGEYRMKGFLWNSHVIFERFVKLIIKKLCMRNINWIFSDQAVPLCISSKGSSDIKTSPDIRINVMEETLYLLDVKYKIWTKEPNNQDIYQVIAGGRVTNCEHTGLIYPKTNISQDLKIWDVVGDGNPKKIAAIFIDISYMSRKEGMNEILKELELDLMKLSKN